LRQGRDLSASAALARYLRHAPGLTGDDVLRLLEQVDRRQPLWLGGKKSEAARGWHPELQKLVDALTDHAPLVRALAGISQPMRAWLEGALARRGALAVSDLDPETLPRLAQAWVISSHDDAKESFEGLDRVWPEQIWLRAVVESMLTTDSEIKLAWNHLDAALGACSDEELVRCLRLNPSSFNDAIFVERLNARGPGIIPLLEPLCREALDKVNRYMPSRYLIAMAVSARLGVDIPAAWDRVVETVLSGPAIEQLMELYPEARREALLLRCIAGCDENVWRWVAVYPSPQVVDATLRLLMREKPPYIESRYAAPIGRRAPAQVAAFIRACPAEVLPRLYQFLEDARSAEIPDAAAVFLRSASSGLRAEGAKVLRQQRLGDLTPELIAELISGEEPAQAAIVGLLLDNSDDPRARALARELAAKMAARTPLLAARLAHAGRIEPEIEQLLGSVPALPPETKQRVDALLGPTLADRYRVADDVVAAVKAGVSVPDLVRWFLDRRQAASSVSAKKRLEYVVWNCLAHGFVEHPALPLITFRFFNQDAVGTYQPAWRTLFDARVLDEGQLKVVLPEIGARDPASVHDVLIELATRSDNAELVAKCLREIGGSRDGILAELLAHASATARSTAAAVLIAQPSGAAVEAIRAALADWHAPATASEATHLSRDRSFMFYSLYPAPTRN